MILSVIVTVYNREKYIERCLQSLVHQNLSEDDYEIIVINDGSTDASKAMIETMCQSYPQIHLYNKENSGVADTRNVGLSYATGTYLTYLDSDDFVEENAYPEILDIARIGNYDIIVYDAYKTYDESRIVYEFEPLIPEGPITGAEYVLFSPAPWNKIMKRELFALGNISFPSGLCYEDYATIPLLANVATSFYYAKRCVVNYYQGNESITRMGGFQKRLNDMLPASKQLEKLDNTYFPELEFTIYLYLLVRASISYMSYDHYQELDEIADYMKEKYPNWRANPYIKERSLKERCIAYLVYTKKARLIRVIKQMKRRVKKNDKKV